MDIFDDGFNFQTHVQNEWLGLFNTANDERDGVAIRHWIEKLLPQLAAVPDDEAAFQEYYMSPSNDFIMLLAQLESLRDMVDWTSPEDPGRAERNVVRVMKIVTQLIPHIDTVRLLRPPPYRRRAIRPADAELLSCVTFHPKLARQVGGMPEFRLLIHTITKNDRWLQSRIRAGCPMQGSLCRGFCRAFGHIVWDIFQFSSAGRYVICTSNFAAALWHLFMTRDDNHRDLRARVPFLESLVEFVTPDSSVRNDGIAQRLVAEGLVEGLAELMLHEDELIRAHQHIFQISLALLWTLKLQGIRLEAFMGDTTKKRFFDLLRAERRTEDDDWVRPFLLGQQMPFKLNEWREKRRVQTRSVCWQSDCQAVAKVDEKFLVCGHCQLVAYCSPACQKKHWQDSHREECGKSLDLRR
eukprot:TRINITY_DN59232_c0_g1_i1.p1 TRINITY_DN59232_c0_g1~~TRINITY_DN59232_c0_g1_i1.p1  ORF type:complete len:411 (+),score=46.53 TRINITY_DN59232_c0_g1_i1:70-1302(+)